MRIIKVYTRTGDKGKTRLAGGQPVWKDDLRVEAYGTVDELNAVLGAVRAFNAAKKGASGARRLEDELRWMQNKLFDVGGLLATAKGQQFPNMPQIIGRDVTRLEKAMDHCQEELAPLKEFILPGGESVDPAIIMFLNRLSDALFVWARWVAKRRREPEFLWQRESP
ncbi:MAG: ATP:cob(I)alamin adenosyltransferase [Nitrospirae bacterium]|nr:ATP:cob(I)alamin adenosyltransferase [Nitrospirota bacterium]